MKRLSQPQRQRLIDQMERAAEQGGAVWDALHCAWAAERAQCYLPIDVLLLPKALGRLWAWSALGLLQSQQSIDPIAWMIGAQGIGSAYIVETSLAEAVLVCSLAPAQIGLVVPNHLAPRGAARAADDDEAEDEPL